MFIQQESNELFQVPLSLSLMAAVSTHTHSTPFQSLKPSLDSTTTNLGLSKTLGFPTGAPGFILKPKRSELKRLVVSASGVDKYVNDGASFVSNSSQTTTRPKYVNYVVIYIRKYYSFEGLSVRP